MKNIPIRKLKSSLQEIATGENLKVRRVEDVVPPQGLFHDLHRHDYFFILLIKSGSGKHEIDFTAYTVEDSTVFLLRPGQVHQLELQPGSSGFLFEFSPEFYHPTDKESIQRLRRASNKNYCKPERARFSKLSALMNSILEEFTAREEGYESIIRANMDVFFIEFVRESQQQQDKNSTNTSYTQERYEEFLELLTKHASSHKQVSFYTDQMNLSAYQLNEITKTSVGKTSSELINDFLVLEAKRYLLATTMQIKEIADLLGFEDPSYFIRFFKKHMGNSPEVFRTNFR